ncbi:fumarylacetoacetase [Lacisediminimonas profundi]|uniref:fumarylacetoacetase n=1 Tax=Lacisediminimonas profundi TaxID=2603856 RepID=UPI00124B83B4|nr:fumarylacetoacetase [Lacisediminimonas profundi]
MAAKQSRGSWVASANQADTIFPIENLPFGAYRLTAGGDGRVRLGVAIGDQILDLRRLHGISATLNVPAALANVLDALAGETLNAFMGLPASARAAFREFLSSLLGPDSSAREQLAGCLVPQADVQMQLPCMVRDYTDFYASIHHATAVGKMMRPDNPLLPNYKWVPIGYHGRASTVVVSGTPVRRPSGQVRAADAETPSVGPSKRLDYELEMGIFIAEGNEMGEPIPMADADRHFFGLCLLNDWSARDMQGWEYQPLGPFLAKSFATSISPWIVTREALEPFRRPWVRAAEDPQPLAYLDSPALREGGTYDIQLELLLQTKAMRERGEAPVLLSRSNFKDAAYWSASQLITHHASNGCALNPGDLLGTGTMSGPTPGEAGSMLELSVGGKQPITLPSGEKRSFLEDGDTVVIRAVCETAGAVRIGFGECVGTVVAAKG